MVNKLIIDASVALKWFPVGDEVQTQEARKVWEAIRSGEIQAYAPVFLLVEIANVLFKKKKVETSIVSKIVERIRNSEITFLNLESYQIPELVSLMGSVGLSAYDSQYLLIAREKHIKVLCVDGPMLNLRKDCIGLDAWK